MLRGSSAQSSGGALPCVGDCNEQEGCLTDIFISGVQANWEYVDTGLIMVM